MFIVYYGLVALKCFTSRDDADEYVRDNSTIGFELDIEFEEEDEDFFYNINR